MIQRITLALVFLVLLPLGVWTALRPATALVDMTNADRMALREEVHAYLLENPEVIIEAMNVLDQRQQKQKTDSESALLSAHSKDIYNDGFSYSGGNPDGDVTLVEFLDYRCAYCRKAHDEVAELVKSDGNIRLVVKEFPILGRQSLLSSKLAIATLIKAGPDAYLALSDFLMTYKGNLNKNTMSVILKNNGQQPSAILAFMNDDQVSQRIAKTNRLAMQLQISGTPTFVLGGGLIRGYVPLATMRQLVKAARTAKN